MNIRDYNISSLLYALGVLVLFLLTLWPPIRAAFPWALYIPLIMAALPIFFEAVEKLYHAQVSTELFISVATIVALIGHEEVAITVILLIMLFAHYLEGLVKERTELAIKGLIRLIPHRVEIKDAQGEREISLEQVIPGMQVVVKTGGRIPVDGYVVSGQAGVNESALTGESALRTCIPGDRVLAGTYIESGSLIIGVEKVGQETFFAQIIALVETAHTARARISVLADVIAMYLVPGLLLFIGLVWFFTGDFRLVMTLLVFGSPLELTIITPLTVLSGVVAAFRHGVLIKGGIALERLSAVDMMVFDKTGTLTQGQPEVAAITPLIPAYSELEILTIASRAEKFSGHVIAKAIVAYAMKKGIVIDDPDYYETVPGQGIIVGFASQRYYVGSAQFMSTYLKLSVPDFAQSALQTIFYIADEKELIGSITLADAIRPEAAQVIQVLKDTGIRKVIMLSGDRSDVVKVTGTRLGLTESYGELLPDQKLKMLKHWQEQGRYIAMIGDGINDAPALKQAEVGIALGGMGMAPAIDAADIVLMTNDLTKILFVRELALKTFSIIKQNIFFGFILVHLCGMVLAFLGYINPVQAALLHAVPDIAILINSTRLIGFTYTMPAVKK